MRLASYINNAHGEVQTKEPHVETPPERKALTFDLYGCILNYRLITHFIGQIARENGVVPELAEQFFQIYLERLKYCGNFSSYRDLLTQVMCYLDMELNTSAFSHATNELILIHADLKAHNDVLPNLHHFKEQGWEIYVLANSSLDITRRILDRFDGILTTKSFVFTDEVKAYKPNISFFKHTQDKFNLRMIEHYHVASNYYTDIIPANSLHWKTIYVNRSKTGIYQDSPPSVVINNLDELTSAIRQINKQLELKEQQDKERLEHERQVKLAEQARQKARDEELQRQALERMNRFVANQSEYSSHNNNRLPERSVEQDMTRKRSLLSRITGFVHNVEQHRENNTTHPQQHHQGEQAHLQNGNNQHQVNHATVQGQTVHNDNHHINFVPQNKEDEELLQKMRSMPPAKAKAIALARERALMHAKLRSSLSR